MFLDLTALDYQIHSDPYFRRVGGALKTTNSGAGHKVTTTLIPIVDGSYCLKGYLSGMVVRYQLLSRKNNDLWDTTTTNHTRDTSL